MAAKNLRVTEPTTVHRPSFLTPEELAELFTVPLETVYQWRRKHTGPPGFRVGRHLRYDLAAVLAWVSEQTEMEVN
ncbi:helix-turn-helix domain-containing protein [Nonomuraea sp. NPDC051191]|uniref:helix-turn-helix domain-containing protein n=1 Tax=Nonomuraea sp. NPDC051191 TaxID=3364372 RepID=UPI0037B5A45A